MLSTFRTLSNFRAIAMGLGSILACVSLASALQPEDQRPPGRPEQNRPGKGPGLLAEMTAFRTDVPAHPYDIILVSPTPTSMGVSVMSQSDVVGRIVYSNDLYSLNQRTPTQHLRPREPATFLLTVGVEPGATVGYWWEYIDPACEGEPGVWSSSKVTRSPGYRFKTQPRAGTPQANEFTFTIQADSHLDANVTPAVYLQTLANAMADRPSFHIDLGDTFMTDKRGREFKDTLPQYLAQRYYLGQLCTSAPLFMVLGNHDGEVGYANDGPESMAAWSFNQRTKYFPEPPILDNADGKAMYSGRTSYAKGQGANYYEFTWGDAQMIVLDPFWFTSSRPRGGGGGSDKRESDVAGTDENWARTLGRDQYDWLTRRLESSKARYKFVFIHHLVGGLGKANRGGMESSVFFEWGGQNADGSPGFAAHRPGWAMPIHDLLVKHKVSAVMHGHDHVYVRAERDGLVYQCVPQPGNAIGGTRSAHEYGYKSGTILGSPGHLRVQVGAEKATVAFIRSAIPDAGERPRGERSDGERNGQVIHEYTIAPATDR